MRLEHLRGGLLDAVRRFTEETEEGQLGRSRACCCGLEGSPGALLRRVAVAARGGRNDGVADVDVGGQRVRRLDALAELADGLLAQLLEPFFAERQEHVHVLVEQEIERLDLVLRHDDGDVEREPLTHDDERADAVAGFVVAVQNLERHNVRRYVGQLAEQNVVGHLAEALLKESLGLVIRRRRRGEGLHARRKRRRGHAGSWS